MNTIERVLKVEDNDDVDEEAARTEYLKEFLIDSYFKDLLTSEGGQNGINSKVLNIFKMFS